MPGKRRQAGSDKASRAGLLYPLTVQVGKTGQRTVLYPSTAQRLPASETVAVVLFLNSTSCTLVQLLFGSAAAALTSRR